MTRTIRLVAGPVCLSIVVTCLRLIGELAQWNPNWFNPKTGGGMMFEGWTWIIEITWLPVIFGPYFALKLRTAGNRQVSTIKIVALAIVGALLALPGSELLITLLPSLDFPWDISISWMMMIIGAVIQSLAWPELARTLVAYGLGSRVFVTVVIFAAIRWQWGTHYDYVYPGAPFLPFGSAHLMIVFLSQLLFWVGFTVILGSLCGGLAIALRARLITKAFNADTKEQNAKEMQILVNAPNTVPSDVPTSSVAAGVLMVLAGPCSLGLTTTDPTRPSVLALLTMVFAFSAAALSFTRKRKSAVVCTWVYIVITGLFAFTGLMIHPIAFLIRGGIGCLFAVCALWNLRRA